MTNYTSVDTWRDGSLRSFYVAPRPPDLPDDYPIPANVRKLIAKSEAEWVALLIAHAEWDDLHAALGPRPRSAEADREVDAWDALVKQAETTDAAAKAAVGAATTWANAHRTESGAYEVARLDDLDAATAALAKAQQRLDAAAHAVGNGTGVLDTWLKGHYAHDDRPRSIRAGDAAHNERVRAYWTNVAQDDEDALLPGDSVQRGFPVRA